MMQNLNKNEECRGKYFIWLKERLMLRLTATSSFVRWRVLLIKKVFRLTRFHTSHFQSYKA